MQLDTHEWKLQDSSLRRRRCLEGMKGLGWWGWNLVRGLVLGEATCRPLPTCVACVSRCNTAWRPGWHMLWIKWPRVAKDSNQPFPTDGMMRFLLLAPPQPSQEILLPAAAPLKMPANPCLLVPIPACTSPSPSCTSPNPPSCRRCMRRRPARTLRLLQALDPHGPAVNA